MSHALFKVVNSDHVVSITRLYTILCIYLFNELNVFYITILTLLLISDRVIERCYQTVCLKEPSIIIKCERLIESTF